MMNEYPANDRADQFADEVRMLAQGSIEDSLSEVEQTRLDVLLCSNDAARTIYLEYLHDSYQLHRLAQLQESQLAVESADEAEPAEQIVEPTVEPTRWRIAARAGATWNYWRARPVQFIAASAMLTVVAWALFLAVVLPWWREGGVAEVPLPAEDSPPLIVAQITRVLDAQWNEEGAAFHGASLLHDQRIDLKAGLVRVTFKSGASVVLEGPARFEATTINSGRLLAGRMTAQVPPQAVGFAIATPSAVIVDLGTEYGVEVDEAGESAIEVYEGRVRVTAGDEQRELTAGKVARAELGEDGPAFVTAPAGQGGEWVRDIPAPLEAPVLLALDFNSGSAIGAPTTMPGFEEFTMGDPVESSQTFGPLEVQVRAIRTAALDSRRRNTPVASNWFTDEQLLRDFIFGPNAPGEAIEVRIAGLTPGGLYQMAVWSFDTGTKGGVHSDWRLGDRTVREDYFFEGGRSPMANGDYRFSFLFRADPSGEAILRGEHRGPDGRYTVFLNGLQIREVRAVEETPEEVQTPENGAEPVEVSK
jgi:hypothetical protein